MWALREYPFLIWQEIKQELDWTVKLNIVFVIIEINHVKDLKKISWNKKVTSIFYTKLNLHSNVSSQFSVKYCCLDTKFKHVTSWEWFLFGGLRLFCIKLHSLLISKSFFTRPCNKNKKLHIFPSGEREVPGTKFPTLVNVRCILVFLIQKCFRICYGKLYI